MSSQRNVVPCEVAELLHKSPLIGAETFLDAFKALQNLACSNPGAVAMLYCITDSLVQNNPGAMSSDCAWQRCSRYGTRLANF